MKDEKPKDEDVLFREIHKFQGSSFVVIAVLSVIGLIFLLAFLKQMRDGLQVTGLNTPVYWGVYISNFVFFIGLSHAGTLISAILRVADAEWRRPVTRLAEAITVMVLIFGIVNLGVDLGQPLRGPLNMMKFGRFQSPLLWDFSSIATYLVLSSLFLYVAMIPDLAHLRDRVTRGKGIYELLALNFRGTKHQWHQYERAVMVMSVVVIPVAVSVHTVISFVFSMTVQPLWHETMFGPFFVAGAIFSGVAGICIAMYLIRTLYKLGDYLTDRVFDNMGKILLSMSMIWVYFFTAEHLTTWYGNEGPHMVVLMERALGRYQPFWIAMILFNFAIPFSILVYKRTPIKVGIASVFVVIGMYLERFLIVVPTLLNPRLPLVEPRALHLNWYSFTLIELTTIFGSFAIFTLLYYLFSKFVPIIPVSEVWEEDAIAMRAGNEKGTEHLYTPVPKGGQSKNMRRMQFGFLAGVIVFDIGIVGFFLNGIRSGIIFAYLNKEIMDIASLDFALAVNFMFLGVHLTLIYTMYKLGSTLIKGGDEATG
jgi:molybdopterin-containing oxidoreductase family membrane subunit